MKQTMRAASALFLLSLGASSCGSNEPAPSSGAFTPTPIDEAGVPGSRYPLMRLDASVVDGADGASAASTGTSSDAAPVDCPGWNGPTSFDGCSSNGSNSSCTTTCNDGTVSWFASCRAGSCDCNQNGQVVCRCAMSGPGCRPCCPGLEGPPAPALPSAPTPPASPSAALKLTAPGAIP